MKLSEAEILKTITHYLQYQENLGKLYFVRVGSGMIQTREGRVFRSGKVGCPDVIVCVKGKFVGLEVKKPQSYQSRPQIEAQNRIEKAEGLYYVVRSLSEAEEVLKRF